MIGLEKVDGIGGLFFRARDLEAMAAQLRAAGLMIEVDPRDYPNGRFARLRDLEGNPSELWQPADPAGPMALYFSWGLDSAS